MCSKGLTQPHWSSFGVEKVKGIYDTYDLAEFLDSNTIPQVDSDYMFMAGKPTGTLGETVIWDSNTIAVYLAGLYLRTNQINETTDNSKACELLLEHELSCEITSCEDADYYYHDLVQCIEQQSLENQVPFSD